MHSLFNKTFWKFAARFAAIVAVSVGVILATSYVALQGEKKEARDAASAVGE